MFSALTAFAPSRYVNIGMFMLRQLFFGKYDITVHTAKGTHSRLACASRC